MELPLIYGITGDEDDPNRVVLHEATPNVPISNPWYGAVSVKMYGSDVDRKLVSSSNLQDARELYNFAAQAANLGKILEVCPMGSNAWQMIIDPAAYAKEIAKKYGLMP